MTKIVERVEPISDNRLEAIENYWAIAPGSTAPIGIEDAKQMAARIRELEQGPMVTKAAYANLQKRCDELLELIRKKEATEIERLHSQPDEYIDVVFDGPPSHKSGRFVEVENTRGASIKAGRWIDRGDGFWALRILRQTNEGPIVAALREKLQVEEDDWWQKNADRYWQTKRIAHYLNHLIAQHPPEATRLEVSMATYRPISNEELEEGQKLYDASVALYDGTIGSWARQHYKYDLEVWAGDNFSKMAARIREQTWGLERENGRLSARIDELEAQLLHLDA
ncbi:MAG TPA: hypothetical protein VJK73_00080 [Candidatus Paceibacterota bacterium]